MTPAMGDETAGLTRDEERLLRTYVDGPRIWDAATVFEVVVRLAEKEMLVSAGDGGAYAITSAGRRALNLDNQLANKQ